MHIIFRNGLNAAKKNIGPGLLLQGFALAIVLLYYFHPATRQLLLEVPKIRQTIGFLFPVLATAFFGGLIPFLFLAARKKIAAGRYVSDLLFMLGFWAITGLAIDSFYHLQSAMFGNQVDVATIIKKVLADQFVFSVFWSAPFAALCMHWKNCGYSFRAAIENFSRKQFMIQLPSILLALWAVWIPTVACVYCLPQALQFPLVNIVLCFWSLLLTALNAGEKNEIDCQ
jgi:hypothetical protein